MLSKILKVISLLLGILFFMSACSNDLSDTKIEFSFNTNISSNSEKSKSIFVNEDMDILELNAELEVDSGDVTVQVADLQNEKIIWDESFNTNKIFIIELVDLKKDTEYSLTIFAQQSKKVKLTISTEYKVTKDKEKPDKYIVEKQ